MSGTTDARSHESVSVQLLSITPISYQDFQTLQLIAPSFCVILSTTAPCASIWPCYGMINLGYIGSRIIYFVILGNVKYQYDSEAYYQRLARLCRSAFC